MNVCISTKFPIQGNSQERSFYPENNAWSVQTRIGGTAKYREGSQSVGKIFLCFRQVATLQIYISLLGVPSLNNLIVFSLLITVG